MIEASELRDYQLEGIEFLKAKKRALLADQPGLGKTVQAAMAAEKPVTVIAPTYLTYQWYEFLGQQFPNDVVALANGTRKQRAQEIAQPADWLIVNHDMLWRYVLPIPRTVIIDESHYVRNHQAAKAKATAAYAKRAEYCYLLSATPIVKEPDDIWHQLHIIDPVTFSSYYQFVYRWCRTYSDRWRTQILGITNTSRMREMLKRYALWRTYDEVRLQLPDLLPPTVIPVEFTPAHKAVYNGVKLSYRDPDGNPLGTAMEVVQTLRRLTVCTEKFDALRSLIDDVHSTGGKERPIVIFCWYRDTVERLVQFLGPTAVGIHGDIDPWQRSRLAKLPQYKYRVATLASLSEGVDLSDSRTVIFFEEDYVPGTMYQALSRIRRWTTDSDEPVRAYYLHMKGSVDENVHKMQSTRNATIEDLMKEALK